MTSITFENAALSEAVKRAARVAPTRGEAFDKAAGIVLEIDPANDWPAVIKATNLSIYYTEFVSAASAAGEKVAWRVSSELFANIATKLPIGSGKTVTITQEEGKLSIVSGRFKAKIGLMRAGFYPEWGLFDPEQTLPVGELGTRLDQVAWACTKGNGMEYTDGVLFDGAAIHATDKYKLATVPLEAPHLGEGVTINATLLKSLLAENGSVRAGLADNQLLVLPNDFIQIRAIALAVQFPNLARVQQTDYPNSITFDKAEAIEAIGRVVSADASNRLPELSLFVGNEEFVFYMEDSSGVDKLMDQIDIPGQATHDRHRIFLNPNMLVECLNASPTSRVTMHYDTSNYKRLLYFSGGDYQSWLVPRTGVKQEQGGES